MNHHHRSFNPIQFMKASHLRNIALAAVMTTSVHAQTIDWGSDVDSVFIDSQGYTLGTGYTFELGAFDSGFDLAKNPLATWFAHWNVFDAAAYDATNGYFTGTAQMLVTGLSNSPDLRMSSDTTDPNTTSFSGLEAYLWIRNDSTTMEKWGGSEWLLVRSADWFFPTYGCCNPALLLEWSVSDLLPANVPLYGWQKSPGSDQVVGKVDTTFTSSSSGGFLQTGTYLPEPSSAVMVLVLGAMAVLDRRRRWHS